jgi:hypothetical protein
MAKKRAQATRRLHSTRFPNEKPAYRAARDKLLKAEIALRRQVETVAAMRRKLPLGGALKEDYVFDEGGRTVSMSELFTGDKNTLLVYSFMFGPDMKSACPSCTSILDGLDGQAPHVTQRPNMVVIAKSPIERIREFAQAKPAIAVVGRQHLQPRLPRGNRGRRADPDHECLQAEEGARVSRLEQRTAVPPGGSRPGCPARRFDLAALEPAGPHAGGARDHMESEAAIRMKRT